MERILALSPTQFEDFVAEYLRALGYQQVRRTGGAGDLGVDIRCQDEAGRLVAVQCKRYKIDVKITSPDIQKFYGMVIHHNASKGIFVTTSSYTQPARNLARSRDIELIDGTRILSYVNGTDPELREIKRARERDEHLRAQERAQEKRRSELEWEACQGHVRPRPSARERELQHTEYLELKRVKRLEHERQRDAALKAGKDFPRWMEPVDPPTPIPYPPLKSETERPKWMPVGESNADVDPESDQRADNQHSRIWWTLGSCAVVVTLIWVLLL